MVENEFKSSVLEDDTEDTYENISEDDSDFKNLDEDEEDLEESDLIF